jgi:hypothetical protein
MCADGSDGEETLKEADAPAGSGAEGALAPQDGGTEHAPSAVRRRALPTQTTSGATCSSSPLFQATATVSHEAAGLQT